MKMNISKVFLLILGSSVCMLGQSAAPEPVPDSSGCPKFEVVGPPFVVHPGEIMRFRVEIEQTDKELEFEWTVDKGAIISGQGEKEIVVGETDDLERQTVIATVRINGFAPDCSNQDSDTGVVAGLPEKHPWDDFGKLANDDLRGRIDNMFIVLQSRPGVVTCIVTYGPPNDVAKRRKIILDHIEFRKYDRDRIRLEYRGFEETIRTIIWAYFVSTEQLCSE